MAKGLVNGAQKNLDNSKSVRNALDKLISNRKDAFDKRLEENKQELNSLDQEVAKLDDKLMDVNEMVMFLRLSEEHFWSLFTLLLHLPSVYFHSWLFSLTNPGYIVLLPTLSNVSCLPSPSSLSSLPALSCLCSPAPPLTSSFFLSFVPYPCSLPPPLSPLLFSLPLSLAYFSAPCYLPHPYYPLVFDPNRHLKIFFSISVI